MSVTDERFISLTWRLGTGSLADERSVPFPDDVAENAIALATLIRESVTSVTVFGAADQQGSLSAIFVRDHVPVESLAF